MHVFDTPATTKITNREPQSSDLKMHVFKDAQNKRVQAASNPPTIVVKPASVDNQQPQPALYRKAEVYLKTGYRQDELDWNTGMFTGTPNILSELTWDNIEIATLNAGTTLFFKDRWLTNLDFTYGRIFDGDNQDSDYLGDNRTFEFSRSNNGSDEGDVYDISAHVGYRIPLTQYDGPYVELRPLVGLSYHAQNLKMVDGYQTVSNFGFPVAVGPFEGLDSSYDATWFGPWLGLESLLEANNKLAFTVGLEYHYAFFDAEADWNLRSDRAHPVSFRHEAEGYGWVGRVSGDYQLNDRTSLNLTLNYQSWKADRDTKRIVYAADGTSSEPVALNEVNWDSFSASIGIKYDF